VEPVPVVAVPCGFFQKVLLMLIMRWEVSGGGCNSRSYFERFKFGLRYLLVNNQVLNFLFDFLSDCLLFFRMIEDSRGILRTFVLLLTVVSCRVMEREKEPDKIFIGGHFVVETDL
jgi:hypothetical protein